MNETPDPNSVSWNPPVPGTSWAPDPTVSLDASAPVVEAEVGANPAPPKRRRAVAIVGAGALVAAGVFAVSRVAGGDSGGAESPEAAIEQLIGSINDEDALGAMDVLLPGERRTFLTPMKDMVTELRRLEVLDDSADLGAVGGVDIEIELGDLDVDEVADDIATVTLSGQASITVDEEKLPLGRFLVDEMLGGERPDGTTDDQGEFGPADDVRLATVRHDGRWYVSLFYTIAEAARGDARLPDPEDAVQPRGSESPEAAVEQLIDAMTDLDLEDVIASLNPDEFSALQRYAPIFLDDAQTALDELGDLDIVVTDIEFDVQEAGDGQAKVGFTAFVVEGTIEGDSIELEWDGECMRLSGSGIDAATGCVDDEVDLAEDDPLVAALASGAQAFDGTHPVATAKVDGEWYVTFIGSFLDAMVEGLRGLDTGDLDEAMTQIEDALGGGLTEIIEGGDVLDPDLFPTDVETDSTDPGVSGSVGGSSSGEATPGDDDPDLTFPEPIDETSAKLDECYLVVDLDGALACFQEGIDAGVLTELDVPAPLRFQECGLAEGWWDYVAYESLTDTEFVDLMTAANACFQGHIDAGDMDPLEMPSDASFPECWNGINPYLLDDEGYGEALDAFITCSEE